MPEKEGAEEKSTKSVVKKKQKQMMGEEGYDIARDMGKVRPSKDKKDATTMPVSKEMRKTQKVNKGPSAFELVKKKYGKAVMNVGKKKANEELDLTKIAEALGGYIIEKKSESERSVDRFIQADDPFNPPSEEEAARRQVEKDAGEKVKKSIQGTPAAKNYKRKGKIKLDDITKGGPVKVKYTSKAAADAAAASDALDAIASDKKIMGRPTPSVKKGVEKTVKKPLQDRVRSSKESLTKRAKERREIRGTKKAQRVAGASGEGMKAYQLAKGDIAARELLKKAGASGDVSPTAPKSIRDKVTSDRESRATSQGTPKPSFDTPKKGQTFGALQKAISDIRSSNKRLYDTGSFPELKPSLVQQRKQASPEKIDAALKGNGDDESVKYNAKQNLLRRLDRERAIGSGATPIKQSAFPDNPVTINKKQKVTDFSTGKENIKYQVKNPSFSQFNKYAQQAQKDIESLTTERDKLSSVKGKKDTAAIRAVNKRLKGALNAADVYTAASKGVGNPAAPIRMTNTEKNKPPVDTAIGAYLKGKSNKSNEPSNEPSKPNKGGALVKGGTFDRIKKVSGSLIQKTRRYPALSFALYDRLKDTQNPFSIRGGRAGMASARGGGGL
jgi:hypothetical protein